MAMSKKHYASVAAVIRQRTDALQTDLLSDDAVEIAEALAVIFKEDNPRFDERTFFSACGYYGMGVS